MASAPAARAERRILLLAPNWLGDVVMATPLLTRLAAARGAGIAVVLAVRRRWAPLFRGDPRVDELIEVQRTGRHAGLGGIRRLADDLRRVGAEAAVLGPPSLRAALVARLAGIPVRVGYRGDGRSWLLRPGLRRMPRGRAHLTEEFLALGEALAETMGLPLRTGGEIVAPALPGCPVWSPPAGREVWAVGPGATYGEAKSWPAERLAGLVSAAVRERGAQVLLLGDGAARGRLRGARDLRDLAWSDDRDDVRADVVDLAGRTDVAQAAALLAGSHAYVGNDSGLMHLATALGVPTLGVFGSTDPRWTGPRGRAAGWVAAEGFPCRPCFRRTCNQPRFCLETVEPEQVLAELDRIRSIRGGKDTP